MDQPIALVRPPGSRLDEGLVTHQTREPVDLAVAERQWHEYIDALRSAGWEIRVVEGRDDCPDAVFIEDTAVVFDEVSVLARPGAPTRRAEVEGVMAPLKDCGLAVEPLERGTLDGGDVLKIGRRAWVGRGGRTDDEGIAALADLLGHRGWSVHAVPISRVLHLKSAVTALPDGTIIGFPPLVDDESVFDSFRAVPEPAGSHVVITGPDRLLMASSAPQTAAMFRADGYEVDLVDIGEFEKLEGCVTCLSIRVR